jgi:hypothetical protein
LRRAILAKNDRDEGRAPGASAQAPPPAISLNTSSSPAPRPRSATMRPPRHEHAVRQPAARQLAEISSAPAPPSATACAGWIAASRSRPRRASARRR